MASVFKLQGKAEYTIVYTDEHGKRRKKKGYTRRSAHTTMIILEFPPVPSRGGRPRR